METPKNCTECPRNCACKSYYGGSTCAYKNEINSK